MLRRRVTLICAGCASRDVEPQDGASSGGSAVSRRASPGESLSLSQSGHAHSPVRTSGHLPFPVSASAELRRCSVPETKPRKFFFLALHKLPNARSAARVKSGAAERSDLLTWASTE